MGYYVKLDIPEKPEPAVSLSPKWAYKKWMTAVIVLFVSLCCIIYPVWIDPCALDVSTTACRLLLSMGICGVFLGASLFFPATRKENWALAGIMSLLAVLLYTINPATFFAANMGDRLVPNTILAQEIQYKYAQRIVASKPREAISVILKLISTDSSRTFIYQDLAEAYKVLGDSVNYRRYMTEYEKKTRLSSYDHDYRRDVTIYKNFHGQDTTIREEFIEENCIVETRKRGDKILKQTRVCCGDTMLVK